MRSCTNSIRARTITSRRRISPNYNAYAAPVLARKYIIQEIFTQFAVQGYGGRFLLARYVHIPMNDENKDRDEKAQERNWEKDWDEEKTSTAEKEDDVSEKDN